jgi:hypothetical protein
MQHSTPSCSRLDAIELKMEPLQPLQDQVVMLETVVQEQAAQQHELDVAGRCLAEAHSAQSVARPLHQLRQR